MAKKKASESKETRQTEVTVPIFNAPIKWVIPDNLVTRFATNMLVQSIEDKEIKLSFFESKPPITLDASAPSPTEIVAECVASIVISDDRMLTFIEALARHFKVHELAKEKLKKS